METNIILMQAGNWQDQLYRRYHAKVLGICAYFLKDREEAKDACQDVFLKVFRAWGDFEWKCDPLTWISAIAKHDCFSRLEKRRRHFDKSELVAYEERERRIPESDEDTVFRRMRLEKCLPLVRGKMREILRLNLEQGLNHREIAVRMGVSRVAITRRLARFRRNVLEKAGPGTMVSETLPTRRAA